MRITHATFDLSLNLVVGWRRVVSFKPRLPYPSFSTHWTEGVTTEPDWMLWGRKSFPFPLFELNNIRPACSVKGKAIPVTGRGGTGL
jgi:hypothetical protein